LPPFIASLKLKGRPVIVKMERRIKDEGGYQLLYKQIDDEIFSKIYLSSAGTMVLKERRVCQ
jgi:predicted transcriptional regulator